jgi:hypothetical protein
VAETDESMHRRTASHLLISEATIGSYQSIPVYGFAMETSMFLYNAPLILVDILHLQ